MTSKKSRSGPTDDDLLAELEGLGTESQETKTKQQPASSKSSKATSSSIQSREAADPLVELENLAAQERPKSRPHTPRNVPGSAGRTSADAGSGTRILEEKAQTQTRKSADSTRSFHQPSAPVDNAAAELGRKAQEGLQQAQEQVSSVGGGWWGALTATATAAVKQAEAIAKDLRENEEAQKWAEQVKGNVGVLRSYGEY